MHLQAEKFAQWRLKLKVMRAWQTFSSERTRAKMLSHKATLGLHFRSVAGACGTLTSRIDDLHREQQDILDDRRLTHDEQRITNKRLLELCQSSQADVAEVRRIQAAEREGVLALLSSPIFFILIVMLVCSAYSGSPRHGSSTMTSNRCWTRLTKTSIQSIICVTLLTESSQSSPRRTSPIVCR